MLLKANPKARRGYNLPMLGGSFRRNIKPYSPKYNTFPYRVMKLQPTEIQKLQMVSLIRLDQLHSTVNTHSVYILRGFDSALEVL